MRKVTSILLAVTILLTVGAGAVLAQEKQFISIASGGTAGTYYPLCGALAEIFNEALREEVKASAEVTGASVTNVRLIEKGEAQVALIQNDVAFYSYKGIGVFKGAGVPSLRAIGAWYPETVNPVALAGAGIKSIADFRGKRISVGAPGSGIEFDARQIVEVYGMTYDDFKKTDYLSMAESSGHMKDKHIDAAFLTTGHPSASVLDLAAMRKVVLVSIEPEMVEKLRAKYPFYVKVTIPAGTYKWMTSDLPGAAVMSMLVCLADMDEDIVYKLTKAMWENVGHLAATHVRGKDITLAGACEGIPIPLHPGAKRYYEEVLKGLGEGLSEARALE